MLPTPNKKAFRDRSRKAFFALSCAQDQKLRFSVIAKVRGMPGAPEMVPGLAYCS
jgi:hypothetical protein